MPLPGSITLHWYRRGSALWARLSTRFHNIARRFDLLAVLRSMDPLGADGAGGQPSGSAAGGDGLYNVTEQANSADADMADATSDTAETAAMPSEEGRFVALSEKMASGASMSQPEVHEHMLLGRLYYSQLQEARASLKAQQHVIAASCNDNTNSNARIAELEAKLQQWEANVRQLQQQLEEVEAQRLQTVSKLHDAEERADVATAKLESIAGMANGDASKRDQGGSSGGGSSGGGAGPGRPSKRQQQQGGGPSKRPSKAPEDLTFTNKNGKSYVRSSHVKGFCRKEKLCTCCFKQGHWGDNCTAEPATGYPKGFKP